jgi:hypothetical protein
MSVGWWAQSLEHEWARGTAARSRGPASAGSWVCALVPLTLAAVLAALWLALEAREWLARLLGSGWLVPWVAL